MTEEQEAYEQIPDPELVARFFTVGDVPYCVWDWDLDRRNIEYLESLDPDYFAYVARANLPNLEAEDPKERQRAATAIRMAYHHGLESLFALVFAALQERHCVVGWMQMYAPVELRRLVKAVSLSWRRDEREERRAYRERVLPYVWLKPREFLWDGIAKTLIRPTGEQEQVAKTQELFAGLWSRIARDFLNDSFADEYNSIKHGLRTGSGGFYFAIGPEEVPGEPAPPEKMHLMGSSEHGSSFFMRRTLVDGPSEKEKRARQSERHFRVRRQSLNWDPRGLAQALALIAISIHNVRACLLAMNGVDASGLKFHMLPEEAFRGPLGQTGGVWFTNWDSIVLKDDVTLYEKGNLKQEIAEGMRQIRDRRGSIRSKGDDT